MALALVSEQATASADITATQSSYKDNLTGDIVKHNITWSIWWGIFALLAKTKGKIFKSMKLYFAKTHKST